MYFSAQQALGIDTEDDIHQLANYFLKAGMLQPDVPEEPKPEPITAEAQVIAEMAVSGNLHPIQQYMRSYQGIAESMYKIQKNLTVLHVWCSKTFQFIQWNLMPFLYAF